MIKKGCLFGLVLLCSLFVLTGCPTKPKDEEVANEVFENVSRDFSSLMEVGFVPPVVRLGETYVNDKVESKEKTLSYEYYYLRLSDGEDFSSVMDKVFNPGNSFHTATIKEADAGDASKTKLKYDNLKAVNGGEVCIGTKFVLGLIVKNHVNQEVYKARVQIYVTAPKAGVEGGNKTITVPGDQTLAKHPSVISRDDSSVQDEVEPKYVAGKTVYSVSGSGVLALDYGEQGGKTAKVLVK